MTGKSWLAILGGTILATPAAAQLPLPLGGQLLVNTTTDFDQDESAVAVDPNGNFLVVWRSESQDGNLSAIIGRRFSARTGLPLSPELLINLTTVGDQRNPAIAMADDGHFVVVWEGPDSIPISAGVFGSLRAPNGTAISGADEFPVNLTTQGHQRRPAVAMQPGGGFLVAWQDGFGDEEDIVGRIYPPTFPANLPTGELQLNIAVVPGEQAHPAVAASPINGGWLAAWQGPSPGLIPSIFLRPLTSTGSGPNEGIVNTSAAAVQRGHVAVSANLQGDGVVVWEAPDTSFRGIFGRRLIKGVPVGPEEPINLTVSGDQREPSVAMDERGGFITVWVVADPSFAFVEPFSGDAPEGSPIFIQGRKKNASGGFAEIEGVLPPPTDGEFQVNSSGSGFVEPWVTNEPRGNFVVAWQGTDSTDPSGNGVFIRRFADAIFADGFETQTTERWSSEFP